jgi:hypothetical protein
VPVRTCENKQNKGKSVSGLTDDGCHNVNFVKRAAAMDTFSQLALLVAAMCPVSWIMSLFSGEGGKLTVPGYNLPSAGFGLLAFFCLVQAAIVAVLAANSLRYEELREVSTFLLAAALAAMTCFSIFSYVFAKSRFAVRGVWFGSVGLLAFVAGHVTGAM